jgi:hypothetical protein
MCYSMRSRVSAVARTPVKPNRWNSGQMTRRVFSFRLPILAALIVAAAILLLTLPVGFTPSAQAQFFDGGFFPFMQNPWGRSSRRSRHQGYGERRSQPDADYSKAPAPPKRPDTPAQTNVLVFGDAMADWLAYGLELSFAESPEMGVIRKPRTNSGLIRQEVRNDPRGEHPDWPKLIREVLATEKPDFIVMMIGLNDRRPIREQRPPQPAIVKSHGRSEKGAGRRPEAAGTATCAWRHGRRSGACAHLRVPLGEVGRALYQADRRDDRGA